jgi:hypothetical protein
MRRVLKGMMLPPSDQHALKRVLVIRRLSVPCFCVFDFLMACSLHLLSAVSSPSQVWLVADVGTSCLT